MLFIIVAANFIHFNNLNVVNYYLIKTAIALIKYKVIILNEHNLYNTLFFKFKYNLSFQTSESSR